MSEILLTFRKHVPLLREIPDEIYFNLDPSDWYMPSKEISITNIETDLQAHVMTYRLTGMDIQVHPKKHLCAHLKPAKLDSSKLDKLHEWEKRLKPLGISLGVYEKPLKFKKPHLLFEKQ